MTIHARLINRPRLAEIVSITDDISEQCDEIADVLADYENADDLPSSEQGEARQSAREAAVSLIEELLSNARKLEAIYSRLQSDET